MNDSNNELCSKFTVELYNTKISELCINDILSEHGFKKTFCFKLSFVLEEILANIIKYSSYSGLIKIAFEEYSNRINLEIIDDGNHFNPLNSPEPDLSEDILERKESGLGLFVTKNYADSIGYQRKQGKYNVVTLSFHYQKHLNNFSSLKKPIEQRLSS